MDLWIEKSTLDKFVAVGEVEDISFGNKGNIMILFHPKDTPKNFMFALKLISIKIL